MRCSSSGKENSLIAVTRQLSQEPLYIEQQKTQTKFYLCNLKRGMDHLVQHTVFPMVSKTPAGGTHLFPSVPCNEMED